MFFIAPLIFAMIGLIGFLTMLVELVLQSLLYFSIMASRHITTSVPSSSNSENRQPQSRPESGQSSKKASFGRRTIYNKLNFFCSKCSAIRTGEVWGEWQSDKETTTKTQFITCSICKSDFVLVADGTTKPKINVRSWDIKDKGRVGGPNGM